MFQLDNEWSNRTQAHLILLCFALLHLTDVAYFTNWKERPSTSKKIRTGLNTPFQWSGIEPQYLLGMPITSDCKNCSDESKVIRVTWRGRAPILHRSRFSCAPSPLGQYLPEACSTLPVLTTPKCIQTLPKTLLSIRTACETLKGQ